VPKLLKNILVLTALSGLSACSTVKVPNIDFVKLPGFEKEAENIGGYPNAAEAPEAPTDTRSKSAWDSAAKDIIRQRDGFVIPSTGNDPIKTDAQIEQELQRLKEKAREYKLDDPAE